MGNRISSLPIAQYCGKAARLGDEQAAGRRALMGTAFHDWAETGRFSPDKHGLTKREADEMSEWIPPVTFKVNGHVVDYKTMNLEQSVELTLPNGVATGHPDAWTILDDTLLVVDIKSTRFSAKDGLDSLQLHGYAAAIMESVEIEKYVVGIYVADTGEFSSSHVIAGEEKRSWFSRVYAAAANTETVTGPHCMGCYQRLSCSEHTIAAIESLPGLEAMGNLESMSEEQAAEVLQKAKALKSVLEKVDDNLKAWARKNGGIPLEPGYVWGPVETAGRVSLTVSEVKQKYPEVYAECSKRGAPSVSFRRVKKG